jgi:hypothetical protein
VLLELSETELIEAKVKTGDVTLVPLIQMPT